MIVVADASPIVVLVNIKHVDVLPSLFGQVIIPIEVAAELSSHKRSDDVRSIIASPPDWLEIRSPASVEQIPGLHIGEMAAISLAVELAADRLIIDEAAGRKVAVEKGLKIVGTVGVLEVAAERGLIELGPAFERLKGTDFWLPAGFLDSRLQLFRERHADQN